MPAWVRWNEQVYLLPASLGALGRQAGMADATCVVTRVRYPQVVYVRIRGLPHPVLVAARDIESGERLATYKEPAWWTTQAVEFALATRSMYNLRLHGLMCD